MDNFYIPLLFIRNFIALKDERTAVRRCSGREGFHPDMHWTVFHTERVLASVLAPPGPSTVLRLQVWRGNWTECLVPHMRMKSMSHLCVLAMHI